MLETENAKRDEDSIPTQKKTKRVNSSTGIIDRDWNPDRCSLVSCLLTLVSRQAHPCRFPLLDSRMNWGFNWDWLASYNMDSPPEPDLWLSPICIFWIGVFSLCPSPWLRWQSSRRTSLSSILSLRSVTPSYMEIISADMHRTMTNLMTICSKRTR